jgi:succinate dehydrogenase / fumarate reductase, cytochrome b subunit
MATQTKNRPLSPHLLIYRPQITSVLSILHRMTGVALAMGLLLLTYWLSAAAYGPAAFARAQEFLGSWIGLLMLFGWTFCIFYHLCNGIRHLFWDVGLGLELTALRASGIAVVIISLVLTAALWASAFSFGGTM